MTIFQDVHGRLVAWAEQEASQRGWTFPLCSKQVGDLLLKFGGEAVSRGLVEAPGSPSASAQAPPRGPCDFCHAPIDPGSDTLCTYHLAEQRKAYEAEEAALSRHYQITCDRCARTIPESERHVHLSVTGHETDHERIVDYIETRLGTFGTLDLCNDCFGGLVAYFKGGS